MENLRLQNFTTALDLLKQSENLLLTAHVPADIQEAEKTKLLALTYNNLGCLYKKKRQANVALSYLKKALDLEVQSKQDQMNIAGAMLNICAILSQLKKHKKAIEYAQGCLERAEQVLKRLKQRPFMQADSGSDTSEQQLQRDSYIKNVYTTMTIALYNLGVEHEYLSEYQTSIELFNRAMYITQEILERDPHMTKVINEGLQSVLMKQQRKMVIANIYGQKASTSPGRLMIDMNSSRFEPIDSKRQTAMTENYQRKFTQKKPENQTELSISSGSTSLVDQISQIYGSKQQNTQPTFIRRMAQNQTKLVFNPQERRAISNIRGSTNNQQSPLRSTYYGTATQDDGSRRRAVFTQRPAIPGSYNRANVMNRTKNEFSLPRIQGRPLPLVQHQDSDLNSSSSQNKLDQTNQSFQTKSLNKAQSQIPSTSLGSSGKKTNTYFSSNRKYVQTTGSSHKQSRQPLKMSPIKSYNYPSSNTSQLQLNKTQQHSQQQRSQINITRKNDTYDQALVEAAGQTTLTFGGYDQNDDQPKSSSTGLTKSYNTQMDRSDKQQMSVQELKMQQAISNINLKLGDLQNKLKFYKAHEHEMILEVDNEVSFRQNSTNRSGVGLRNAFTEDIVQKSVNFDQLSYVSSEAQL